MAALLDGGLAAVFGAAFGSVYLPGKVHAPAAPVFDEGGSIVPGAAPTEFDCRVQPDKVSERMRATDGYTDKDIALIVLTSGLGTAIDTDCRIEVLSGMHSGLWMIDMADLDAAGSHYMCRGRRA